MATKTKFVKFIGNCALNLHQVELRAWPDGTAVLRHERGGQHSGIAKSFSSIAEAEDFCGERTGATRLNETLGKMGVKGFPAV